MITLIACKKISFNRLEWTPEKTRPKSLLTNVPARYPEVAQELTTGALLLLLARELDVFLFGPEGPVPIGLSLKWGKKIVEFYTESPR